MEYLSILVRPFKGNFYLLIWTFVFSAIVDMYSYTIVDSVAKSVYVALHHFCVCYILVFFAGLLKGIYKRGYICGVGFLLALNLIIDSVCLFCYNYIFSPDIASIIKCTNMQEAKEYFNTYVSPMLLFGVCTVLCMFVIAYLLLKKLRPQIGGIFVPAFFAMLTIAALFGTIIQGSKNWGNVSVTKLYQLLKSEAPPSLEEYFTNPKLLVENDSVSNDIVLIIGESLSKSHMSLYGYNKETNPLLSELQDDSMLLVFENVLTPELSTIATFKCIMSTYKPEYNDDINWYECTTLLEVMSLAGYKTAWMSNQSAYGIYDNVITKYAELVDTTIFVGNRFSGSFKDDLDELLLDIETDEVHQSAQKRFHIIHMMGSHPAFNMRYPKNYSRFQEEDYEALPVHQRKTIAEYDNSVLYNDSVVCELMNRYKDNSAVVIYMSDHSIDIFEGTDSYVGHALRNNAKSVEVSSKIPFMIYVTPQFVSNNTELFERMKISVGKDFRTDDIIYTIMDIAGVRFKENNDVETLSLFD